MVWTNRLQACGLWAWVEGAGILTASSHPIPSSSTHSIILPRANRSALPSGRPPSTPPASTRHLRALGLELGLPRPTPEMSWFMLPKPSDIVAGKIPLVSFASR